MAFLAERLEKIREILLERKSINITTLCKLLNVSDITIRKDLERLEEEKFLKKYTVVRYYPKEWITGTLKQKTHFSIIKKNNRLPGKQLS